VLTNILNEMIDAAKAAGKIANYYRFNPNKISVEMKREEKQKHGSTPTPVSITDSEIESKVFSELRKKHPDFAFLGEESYGVNDEYRRKEHTFIIDPLDGTRAFIESIGVHDAEEVREYLSSLGIANLQDFKKIFGEGYFFDKKCAAPTEKGFTVWGLGAYLEEKEIDSANADKRFMKRISEHAIHIGLTKEGESVAGVVYLPMTDELYCAEKGKGAFLNNRRIFVSDNNNISTQRLVLGRYNIGSDKLDDKDMECIMRAMPFAKRALVVFGHKKLYQNLSFISNVPLEGSCGVKICHVADATYDVFLHTDGMPGLWDICAPEIILREAGGTCTDLLGQPFDYRKENPKLDHGFIITNGRLHDYNLEIIRKVLN
jgi:fructose-1,6-bisphosphatase/inositol monophosphatase family enzyme